MDVHEKNGLTGVVFSAESMVDVRQWVQDRAAQGEIVATPTRLYLPVGANGMAAVDPGDTIWWDSEGGVNAFSLERAEGRCGTLAP